MDFGFPSAAHEEEIVIASADLKRDTEQALSELCWNSADAIEGEYSQFFRPDHTWWKNKWMDGRVVVLSDRVRVRIAKFVTGDVVDWTGECAKLVAQFHAKLVEIVQRNAASGSAPG